jgi:hypothetical protein
MITKSRIQTTALCISILLCAFCASAMEYVFPAGAKVIDVTKAPYSADNTGKTDVSAILSKAANDDINVPNWCPSVMYFPNGTYLLKNTFAWKLTSHGNGNGPHLVGQSRKGVVLKLAKGTWPLGTEAKGVIQTGAGDENNFNKGICNLTVLVDSNNAGAIGIIYVSNNSGMISDVDVISADGKGMYGIQSAGGVSGVGGNGPFIIRRTFIKGFDYGMSACGTQGEMMSQIHLEGQSKRGIWVRCGDLVIDSLTTNDTCAAIDAQGSVMLTHGLLLNGSPSGYAIRNWVLSSYYSDIVTTGYKGAITSAGTNPTPKTSSFAEYTPVAPISLFSTQKTSMHLPAKYPPEVAWETDFTKWAFIADYRTGGRTDAQAFQAAIDDPTKTTVCLAGKTGYQLTSPVHVRGNIRRIIGTGVTFSVTDKTNSQIIFDDGAAPVVLMQNMGFPNAPQFNTCQVIKNTSRTVVIETMTDGYNIVVKGAGETYITDVCGGTYLIDNPQARVYMWQWEANYQDSGMIVRNGVLRSVGQYMEGDATNFVCTGGFTEILGSWYYSFCASKANLFMLLIGNNANVSAAGMFQQNFCTPGVLYDQLVRETRGATTKILYGSAGAGRVVSPAGCHIALFTAYDSAAVQGLRQTKVQDVKPVAATTEIRRAVARSPAGIEVAYSAPLQKPATLLTYDLSGRIISVIKGRSVAGIHRMLIPRSACSAGITCIELRTEGKSLRSVAIPF